MRCLAIDPHGYFAPSSFPLPPSLSILFLFRGRLPLLINSLRTSVLRLTLSESSPSHPILRPASTTPLISSYLREARLGMSVNYLNTSVDILASSFQVLEELGSKSHKTHHLEPCAKLTLYRWEFWRRLQSYRERIRNNRRH